MLSNYCSFKNKNAKSLLIVHPLEIEGLHQYSYQREQSVASGGILPRTQKSGRGDKIGKERKGKESRKREKRERRKKERNEERK